MSTKTLNKNSMIEGSLWNKILGFAFPLALTGILQQMFSAADLAVVGNFTEDLGEACMAAVGANTPIMSFIINGFLGISLGTNVVIANAVGRKDEETIQKAGTHFNDRSGHLRHHNCPARPADSRALLRSQNISDEAVNMAITYFRIYVGGLPVILLYNFEAAIFRGMGNTKLPFLALVTSGIINIGLNLFFVLVLHRNVDEVGHSNGNIQPDQQFPLLIFLKKSKTSARFDGKNSA